MGALMMRAGGNEDGGKWRDGLVVRAVENSNKSLTGGRNALKQAVCENISGGSERLHLSRACQPRRVDCAADWSVLVW